MAYEPIASVRTYVVVLVALVVLTFATVGISFFPLAGSWHAALGLGIGVVKASLVLVFFMHLPHASRLNWLVVAIALTWLICVLMALLFCDYLTRDLIPGIPGH